ncbi:MAG: hypothetical protein OES79_00480, partial [Planctomycetota bacterium]|nr:hypothetical protein [Planctomycetota bacterium]
MNTLGRILFLSIFAGGGVAAAVYLSTSGDLSSLEAFTFAQSPGAAPVAAIDPPAIADQATLTGTDADQQPAVADAGNEDERVEQAAQAEIDAASPSAPLTAEQPKAAATPTRDLSKPAGSADTPTTQLTARVPTVTEAAATGPSRPALADTPSFAASGPNFATLRPPVRAQVAVDNREPSLPVSAMMQLLDKVLERREAEDAKNVNPAPPVSRPPTHPLGGTLSAPTRPATPTSATPTSATPTSHKKLVNEKLVNEGRDRLSLQMKDTDIREVLELLGRGSGRNIMATKNVNGTVSATLQDVSFETALRGILKSTGYVAHREGNIIYVGTSEEFETVPAKVEQVVTQIYRPNYIRAIDLQALITPLLTPSIGAISISAPAESGIPADSVNAGGDDYADPEVVLVRDYASVLQQIDQVFQDVDVRPLQVAIEAMILSVKLNDSNRLGVDFELLKDRNDVRIISGNPPLSLGQLDFSDGGLKVGFLNSNVSFFLDALETVGDTDVIATPRLLVLNKQRAEILIGAELGYVSSTVTETATTQSVEFLEVGTQLRIRPFISSDGLVRMEIHPELSTGSVRVEGGFTLPDKEVTEVTTNIIAYDGSTVIIGGLIRDDIASSASQIPLLGSLPAVGPLFRQKIETLDRREILVVITPHIMGNPELDEEGDHAAMEFHHRHAVQFEKLSPLAKRRIAHNYFLKAQRAWALGNGQRALKYVNLAIHYNPQSRAAIDLRADIFSGIRLGDHAAGAEYLAPGHPLDGPEIEEWLLDRMDPAAGPAQAVRQSQAGKAGSRLNIVTPQR